ncbi:MAG: PAS domain S-box protein [Nocardioidaceae bacterium]|nr:PAS domain S-box protein [Nocardioidaceae bacterium]
MAHPDGQRAHRRRLDGSPRVTVTGSDAKAQPALDPRFPQRHNGARAIAAESAREEVATIDEEMQTTSERLETVNEELTATVQGLTTANDDPWICATELAAEHQESEERRSRLEAILSSLGDAVLAVDREGRAVVTNAAYERMFGSADATFEPYDVAGLPLPDGTWPQQRAAAGERFSMEFTLPEPDGGLRWFEAVAEPLTAEDRIWGGVVTIRDVTDRTLRGVLEQMLAAASHELRTPVAALNGYVQLVERQLARGNTERASEYAVKAATQATRLGDLVEQLFDVSRIRSSRLALALTPVDLIAVVDRAVDVAGGLPGVMPIAVAADVDSLSLMADPGRIEQLVVILLANAVEHAPGERIDVVIRRTDGLAEVEVSDTGPGIDPADVPGLFMPFTRLASTKRDATGGLGLGLYIARGIARAHGGDVVSAPRPGGGCTFTVRLPVERGPQASGQTDSRSTSA